MAASATMPQSTESEEDPFKLTYEQHQAGSTPAAAQMTDPYAGLTPTIPTTGDANASTKTSPAQAPPLPTMPGAPPAQAPSADITARNNVAPQVDGLMSRIQTATTPDDRLQAHDELARTSYQALQSAGHDVEWDGPVMVVDGRRYEVAGGENNGALTPPGGELAPPGGELAPPVDQGDGGLYPPADGGGGLTPPDGELGPPVYPTDDLPPDPPTRLPPDIKPPDVELGPEVKYPNDGDGWWGDEGDPSHGHGVVGPRPRLPPDVELDPPVKYPNDGDGGMPPRPVDPTAPQLPPAPPDIPPPPPYVPGAVDNADVPGFSYDQLHGELGPTALDQQTAAAAGQNLAHPYVPGAVDNTDLPGFSYDSVKGDLGHSALTRQTADAASRLLADPSAMDERTVQTMKGQAADEIAQRQKDEEDDLMGLSYGRGLGDSPWLSSERAASRRGLDRSLRESNRAIDTTAAMTRKGDERAALAGASSVAGQQAQEDQSAEGLATSAALQKSALVGDRQKMAEGNQQTAAQLAQSAVSNASNVSAQQANAKQGAISTATSAALQKSALVGDRQKMAEGNQQTAAQLAQSAVSGASNVSAQQANAKQGAISTATSAALQKSALVGDRQKFAESIKQEAARSGQSEQQLTQNYAVSLLQSATTKYGLQLDMQKALSTLQQRGNEFAQQMAMDLAQLQQQDAQFGATYGLQVGDQELRSQDQAFNQYLKSIQMVGGGA